MHSPVSSVDSFYDHKYSQRSLPTTYICTGSKGKYWFYTNNLTKGLFLRCDTQIIDVKQMTVTPTHKMNRSYNLCS